MVLSNEMTASKMFFVSLIYKKYNLQIYTTFVVHQSAVVRPGRKPRYSLFLKGGEEVEFDVVEGTHNSTVHSLVKFNSGLKGLEAAAVSAPGGCELFTYNPRAHPRKNASDDQRPHNTQRRPFKPRPGYKGGRKNNRKQTENDQKVHFYSLRRI